MLSSRTFALILGLGLAVPAAADAASLTVPGTNPGGCLPSNTILRVDGGAWSPNASVDIAGAATATTGFTDGTGAFSTTFLTPNNQTFTPQQLVLTGTDSANPAVTASLPFQVVRYGSNLPLNGKPSAKTTWRFAGFIGGTIYGHFRFGGKTIVNHRFGKAQGVCGTLTSRTRRLPARSRPGRWTLQIDMRKSYSDATRPRVKATFTIRRTFL